MTPELFADILDRFGPDPACWPEDERAAATALLHRSAEAREAYRAARLVAEVLSGDVAGSAGAALRRRVLAIPLEHPRLAPGRRSPVAVLTAAFGDAWRQWTAGATSALAASVLGFLLGYGGNVSLPGLASSAGVGTETELLILSSELNELAEGLE